MKWNLRIELESAIINKRNTYLAHLLSWNIQQMLHVNTWKRKSCNILNSNYTFLSGFDNTKRSKRHVETGNAGMDCTGSRIRCLQCCLRKLYSLRSKRSAKYVSRRRMWLIFNVTDVLKKYVKKLARSKNWRLIQSFQNLSVECGNESSNRKTFSTIVETTFYVHCFCTWRGWVCILSLRTISFGWQQGNPFLFAHM